MIFADGFPQTGERVWVTRKSGLRLIARIDEVTAIRNLHWLTDDDRFADAEDDPIVSWDRAPMYAIHVPPEER